MKKTIIGVLATGFILGTLVYAGQIWKVTGTKTNCVADSSQYTDPIKVANYNWFGTKFNIVTSDTIKGDSAYISVQTSDNQVSWRTFYSFGVYVATDTTSKYALFNLDSLRTYKDIGPWARLKYRTALSTGDTATAETLAMSGTGSVYQWGILGADTSRWEPLNDATIDTTTADTTKAADWLVIQVANKVKKEPTIASIKVVTRGGWDTDTAWFKFGLSLGIEADSSDTSTAKRLLTARTMMKTLDTTTYTYTWTTNPYGTAWNWRQIDSLNFIAKCDSVKSGAIALLAKAIVIVNYTKGNFEPAITWSNRWILKDRDNEY